VTAAPSVSLDPAAVPSWVRAAKPAWDEVGPDLRKWAVRYGRTHVEHFQSVVSMVRSVAANRAIQSVLDVGAVPGHLSIFLRQAGLSVDAVDIDPERMSGVFDAAGIPAHRVDVERHDLPFPDASFDLVLFCEILEHLRINPLRPFREIRRVLAPGGSVVVSVPNITPLMRLRFLRGKDYQGDPVTEFEKLETRGHMGHFRLYSRSELNRILEYHGFASARFEPGGKLERRDDAVDARVLRRLAPERMKSHLYACARKCGDLQDTG
jgi:SAM-dependent methyltransferase